MTDFAIFSIFYSYQLIAVRFGTLCSYTLAVGLTSYVPTRYCINL